MTTTDPPEYRPPPTEIVVDDAGDVLPDDPNVLDPSPTPLLTEVPPDAPPPDAVAGGAPGRD